MFEYIENLQLVSVIESLSSPHRIYSDRANHGFIYKSSGVSRYFFDRTAMELRAGEMLFIPKGSSYTVQLLSEGESRYIAINFDTEISDAVPRKYALHQLMNLQFITKQMARRWLFQTPSSRYQCLSTFYQILSTITNIDHAAYTPRQKFSLIAPAVDYLEEHIFDCSLTVNALHLLCGISDTYFRKIFLAQFGATPQKYIINKRLTQAKALIDSQEFSRISDVAQAVGYEDPLYFSKAFKHRYGEPPSQIIS